MTSRHPAPSPVATAAKLPPPPLLWGGEATNPHHPVHPVSKVPIRASPVRARRPEYRSPQSTISEFQSAPRPCGRGDPGQTLRRRRAREATSAALRAVVVWGCFNPRLARAGEATRPHQTVGVIQTCFNPRLARAGEATGHIHTLPPVQQVSIRASPVRARRLKSPLLLLLMP